MVRYGLVTFYSRSKNGRSTQKNETIEVKRSRVGERVVAWTPAVTRMAARGVHQECLDRFASAWCAGCRLFCDLINQLNILNAARGCVLLLFEAGAGLGFAWLEHTFPKRSTLIFPVISEMVWTNGDPSGES
jgi:hypothetical protein